MIDKKTIIWSARKKKKQEAYEKLVEMSRSNDYSNGNLLDFLYHQNFYKSIGTGLSRQRNTAISQQINFTWKFGKNDGGTMFCVAEYQQKPILKFSLDSLIVAE